MRAFRLILVLSIGKFLSITLLNHSLHSFIFLIDVANGWFLAILLAEQHDAVKKKALMVLAK